jgi:phosphohistidine swiveling domain-containing protein
MVFKYMTPEKCSEYTKLLDHYLAAIFASKDCDHKKYRMKKLPKEVNLCNTWKLLRKIPIMTFYKLSKKYKSNPEKAKETYLEISKDGISKLEQMKERGFDVEKGLQAFADELIHAYLPAFYEEVACIMFVVVPCFNAIEKKRREGKREQIRQENDALCTGYEGDELMAMNIEMHKLASELPASIWDEYQHDDLGKLATRIKDNQEGKISDLPPEFLKEWQLFMELFDYDGQDQLFISCPRYADSPELVLAKLKQNVGATVKDPAITHQEQANKRREVMELHEQRAKKNRFLRPFALGKIKKRNEILEHLMWMRNAPKLRMAKIDGILRAEVLKVEEELLRNGRLEEAGDIFHLALSEVDTGLRDETFDLKSIVAPRKSVYQRATRATICPILVDSRCRILKPDPPVLGGDHEEGTLIGAAVSPGVARGRVRIMNNPNEKFEAGEVLAAFVTGPAWTPLFVGASAVILQIGGVLQHGALCAREYGKPAISNIDVHALLKTGDLVEVDGNTGTVRILPDCRTSLV